MKSEANSSSTRRRRAGECSPHSQSVHTCLAGGNRSLRPGEFHGDAGHARRHGVGLAHAALEGKDATQPFTGRRGQQTRLQRSVGTRLEAGAPDEDGSGGFERFGWAPPLLDDGASTFISQAFQRADAFLFGRRTYEIFAGSWGAGMDAGNPVREALNMRPEHVASTTLTDPQRAGTTVLSGDVAGARHLRDRPLLQAAHAHPDLRLFYPDISHRSLMLTRKPFDLASDLVKITPLPEGHYQVTMWPVVQREVTSLNAALEVAAACFRSHSDS